MQYKNVEKGGKNTMAILKISDVARRYGVSKTCIRNYMNEGILPSGFKIGHSRRWLSEDLDRFDKEQNEKQKNLGRAI